MIKQYGLGINNFSFMTFGFGTVAYDPVTLFSAGQQGAIYDPSDLTSLWQDAAGTVPVTKSGDPVGLMRDKSGNNNHATQTVSAARPTYNGLRYDGVDDFMNAGSEYPSADFLIVLAATVPVNTTGNTFAIGSSAAAAVTASYLDLTSSLNTSARSIRFIESTANFLEGSNIVGTGKRVISIHRVGLVVSMFLDGVLMQSKSWTPVGAGSAMFIGKWGVTTSKAVDVADVLYVNGVVSNQDRKDAEKYLMSKGVTL